MLIFNVIDNGLDCNCGVCIVLHITDFARNAFLKMGCTTYKCFIFGIQHLLKVIIFYALKRL